MPLSFIDLLPVIAAVIYGYYFATSMPGYHRGTGTKPDLVPTCRKKCVVNIPPSLVHKFDSLSLNSTKVSFVHFSGWNSSFQPSNTTDILDPLNLIWVNGTASPFLSMDLGFNVYSFTTLSRIVHHMNVKVEVEPINCLRNMNHSCVTANLARAFLVNVSRERGILCYTIKDWKNVNYRCCKVNHHDKQVECGISPVLSPEMRSIFIVTAIAAVIAFMCFPALFNIVPDEERSTTLLANSQVHNPLSYLVIRTVHALRHYSTKYYWANVIRKVLIGLALPTLYYIDYYLQWYIQTYDIPKMFNDAVKNIWVNMPYTLITISFDFSSFAIVTLLYIAEVAAVSFFPHTERLDSTQSPSFNQWEPFDQTKSFLSWLRSLFEKDEARSFFSRLIALLGHALVLTLLFPFVTSCIFILYAGHVSPLGKMMRVLSHHIQLCMSHPCCSFPRHRSSPIFLILYLATIPISFILYRSLLLSARLIAYLWIGLAASKDYYFPRIAVLSVFVYYCWNCLSSVTSRYQVLLKQTFEKCQEHQEKHRNGRKALEFDEEGVPRISSELFEKVISQILPRSEVYIKMILKLTVIILFLFLTFESIQVYWNSNQNQSTKALAILLTGLLPKTMEMFGEGDSYQQLYDIENACRVEKIVREFSTQRDDANLAQHSDVRSQESSEGSYATAREHDNEELVVQADVHLRYVQ